MRVDDDALVHGEGVPEDDVCRLAADACQRLQRLAETRVRGTVRSAREADVIEAIRPIGRDLEVDHLLRQELVAADI